MTDQDGWQHLPTVALAGHDVVRASRAELVEAMVHDCTSPSAGISHPRLVFDVNGQGLSLARTDPAYRDAVRHADILHADGGFLVALSRWRTPTPIAERSATTDMMHDFAARAALEGLSFYLLGGTEEVNAECAEKLTAMYPGLHIAGRRNGYFDRSDTSAISDDINASGANVVWVGLGKPYEQQFSVQIRQSLRGGWLITCGGCFNFITGHYRRAPKWMQDANLEWLHRMATRPRQLFWRYAVTTPHALWIALTSPAGTISD